MITIQDRERFDGVHQTLSRALKNIGLEPSPIDIGTEPDDKIWSELATWANGKYAIVLWYGEWFHDLPGNRFWYGFQGTRAALTKLQDLIVDSGISDAPTKFIRYNYNSSWRSYPAMETSGLAYEYDSYAHYVGRYAVSGDLSDNGVIRAAADFFSEIVESLDSSEIDDIIELKADKSLTPTTRKALILARRGQGRFRRDLEKIWNNRCALTGCTTRETLRASHIKPWKLASNEERLSAHNGLLLRATIDALFDKGLISFKDDGSILIGETLDVSDRKLLLLDGLKLSQQPSKEQRDFLRYHREELLH